MNRNSLTDDHPPSPSPVQKSTSHATAQNTNPPKLPPPFEINIEPSLQSSQWVVWRLSSSRYVTLVIWGKRQGLWRLSQLSRYIHATYHCWTYYLQCATCLQCQFAVCRVVMEDTKELIELCTGAGSCIANAYTHSLTTPQTLPTHNMLQHNL